MSTDTPREQVQPRDGFTLSTPHSERAADLMAFDPSLGGAVDDVLGALRQDLVPSILQEDIFRALNPAVQRNMIAEASGLDASILVTFKQQLNLIDAILRRTFKDDGTLANGQEDLGIEPKDVLNLSLKVSQMMVRELPKVYSMDRVQKMEGALLKVMSENLSREQQEQFLMALDEKKEQA